MLAYQGYFESEQFISFDAVRVPDQRRVKLTAFSILPPNAYIPNLIPSGNRECFCLAGRLSP